MKIATAFLLVLLFPVLCQASFEGNDIPIAVKYLPCDSNPRIVVQFADPSRNVWYPANDGENSKSFLAIALAAKATSSNLYYLGLGNATDLTPYCISASARQIVVFGIS